MPSVLETAQAYVAAGMSVIPIRPDGTKAPACGWKAYQSRLPTDAELRAWFGAGENGIAVVCGAVSGNLEVLDFDAAAAFERWWGEVAENNAALLERLAVVATPGDGRHVYCRRAAPPPGNRKLAFGGEGIEIETRGEGGYVLAPGSPPACHPTGGTYEHIFGPKLTELPTG